MNELTDEYIDFIYQDVEKRGIYTETLLHEMVDHICCMIEPQLGKGIPFTQLYQELVNSLHENQFSNIQHQTNLSTNLKFQFMKKSMFISGALGTAALISGVIFKINHWPGASILLVLSTFVIVALFLPLFFIVQYKESTEKKNLFLSIVGYFTISFLILGPVFKIMHWPFTDFFIFFGPLLLATLFIPFYLISIFKKANETKTNYIFIIILVSIGFSFLYSLSIVNISKTRADSFQASYLQNLSSADLFTRKTDSLYTLPDSLHSLANKQQIHESRKALNTQVDQLMLQLIQAANNSNATLTQFENRDDKKVGQKILNANENKKLLVENIEQLRNAIIASEADDISRKLALSRLDFTAETDAYNFVTFEKEPLIAILHTLSRIKLNATLAEYELLD